MAAFHSSCSVSDSDDNERQRAEMFGGQVDQMIRSGMHFCWMALPNDRRNAEELEKQMRRILDRALKDFREDSDAFSAKE